MDPDDPQSRSAAARRYESYLALDRWFSEHGHSYQVHWTPREVLFRTEIDEATAEQLGRASDHPLLHGAECELEQLEGQHHLTARLELAPPGPARYGLHLLLFLLTLVTTIGCGATVFGDPRTLYGLFWLFARAGLDHYYRLAGRAGPELAVLLSTGACFAVPFLFILASHEFGHYFMARRHRVSATLPFFLPVPLGIGTVGAMIALRSPMVHRRTVFDIGVAGPLAGLLLALPIFVYGIHLSSVESLTDHPGQIFFQEGKSLLYLGLLWLMKGPIPEGHDILLHPYAWAGWFGLFVTALNLIPVGQLDGGHVVYAMFGKGHRVVARVCFAILLGLTFVWHGYVLFSALLLFLVKLDHPPAVDDRIRLDRSRYLIGCVVLVIFVLIFVPLPMDIVTIPR